MKNIKNKHIVVQKNSPSKGGFSDIRIRFFVLSCMAIILALVPFLGLIYSSIAVSLFALFLAEIRSRFELCDFECTYHHYQEMDKLYGRGNDAEYCKRQVESYQLMYGKKNKPTVLQSFPILIQNVQQ